jgi:pyruvate dehydrogenase E1 component subunit alpha
MRSESTSSEHAHATDKPHLSRAHLLDLLKHMIRVRRFEDKCAELYTQEKIRGFLHLYDGEEAVAVGVIPVLEARDRIVATYREHGHALVRGVPMTKVMAEMYGKQEGAVAEGEFHESMNLAALWQLPVLFVCENNLYAMGTALARSESETDIHQKAACYNIAAEAVDGMDVVAVEAAARRAVHAVRTSRKPYFLECHTYRLRAHSMFDAQLYREKTEIETWRQREPILRFQSWLQAGNLIHPDDVTRIESEVDAEIAEAVAFAEAGTWEPLNELTRFTYAESAGAAEG